MDFIEQIFGVSPDAGNGLLEAVYLVTLVVVLATIAAALVRRHAKKLHANQKPPV